ncbi:MAG: DUF2971 domain-containing protein [Desulfocapsa sp.]|uniref:DUF2971 domain-containing protein n=1 Tax=Desulfotalea psychrophila TaxID=84980 RepID=A0ABS3AYM1_9BACT|nr:DUF2971 domain-containing protein [Desulfocapsa sp.]MBN4068972.1 DUF2971 domain-containing protein [Desulfotalea psychrophila]
MKKNSAIAYHYCGVESFFNIIQNKTLWLSDSSYMNDDEECIWVDKIIKETLRRLKENQQGVPDRNQLSIFEKTYENIQDKKHYIISFSRAKDLLSQWRGYANDGHGIAIGFQSDLFFDILKISSKSQGVSCVPPRDCVVTTHKIGTEKIIYNINSTMEMISTTLADGGNLAHTAILVKELASTIKHDSFAEEREIRITYTPENNLQSEPNEFIDMPLKKISKIKYRVSSNQIIPFYEFNFSSECNSLLMPEIILGPKCKLVKNDLNAFLKHNGFESTHITHSESPYR